MKEQDLPECGRDLLFEVPDGSIYAGVFGDDGNFWSVTSYGESVFFAPGNDYKISWVYASDAIAAWKREQVRREDSFEGLPGYEPKAPTFDLGKLREDLFQKILHDNSANKVQQAIDFYIDAAMSNMRQCPPEDCISTADLHEQRRYEIAKEVLSSMMSDKEIYNSVVDGTLSALITGNENERPRALSLVAIKCADALLSELEKPQK